jgi:hypothetical protein
MAKMGIESKALIYTYYIAGNREQGTGNRVESPLVYSFLGKFCISFKCIPLIESKALIYTYYIAGNREQGTELKVLWCIVF